MFPEALPSILPHPMLQILALSDNIPFLSETFLPSLFTKIDQSAFHRPILKVYSLTCFSSLGKKVRKLWDLNLPKNISTSE